MVVVGLTLETGGDVGVTGEECRGEEPAGACQVSVSRRAETSR